MNTAGPRPLSLRHKRVQHLRRLVQRSSVRRDSRQFVLEGPKLLEEALEAGAPLEAVYVAPGFDEPVIERAATAGVRVFTLAPGVMERVSDTVTPQPVAAVSRYVDVALDTLALSDLVVVCVDVRDPGNLGTVLRSAEAAGAGGVVCCEGSVDIYNPKCVRASAGSLFHVKVVAGGEPVDVLEALGEWGLRRLGTRPSSGTPYHRADLTLGTAFVLGNEARGLPPEVAAHVDDMVSVPMAGRAESINVGMTAAVLCFEAARQRRP